MKFSIWIINFFLWTLAEQKNKMINIFICPIISLKNLLNKLDFYFLIILLSYSRLFSLKQIFNYYLFFCYENKRWIILLFIKFFIIFACVVLSIYYSIQKNKISNFKNAKREKIVWRFVEFSFLSPTNQPTVVFFYMYYKFSRYDRKKKKKKR